MEIILDENEIDLAIKAYVKSQINIRDDQDIEISYKAGRGENGSTASIKIVNTIVDENKLIKSTVTDDPVCEIKPKKIELITENKLEKNEEIVDESVIQSPKKQSIFSNVMTDG